MTAELPPNPYVVTMDVLEARSRVPREQQTESQVPGQNAEGVGAWDEERRQARLAGGA